MSSKAAVDFHRDLIELVRWLESQGDPTLPYYAAKDFARLFNVSSRTQAGKDLNRYIGKYLEADHLVEQRFQAELISANADTGTWDSKLVPKNAKAAGQLNRYRRSPFPYNHLEKTNRLAKLIPHGMEGMFTPQEIWDAHAWTFKDLGVANVEEVLKLLKIYFRNANVKFRIPKRNPLEDASWKERLGYKLARVPRERTATSPSEAKRIRELRIQRNSERARQRQARERAQLREDSDPRALADKGTENKIGKPRPWAEADVPGKVGRAWEIAGRVLREVGSLTFDALFIWIMALDVAKGAVAHLREDLQTLKSGAEERIKILKSQELENPVNQRLFQSNPCKQFWYRIDVTLTMEVTIDGGGLVFRYTQLTPKSVRIVGSPGKSEVFSPPLDSGNRIYEQGYVEYSPVFEECTRGQLLAADGYPLSVIDAEHGDPTGDKRLKIIYDYIVFAKQHPTLSKQYHDAWLRYSHELCVAGFRDLFSESEIDLCRQQAYYQEIRGVRRNWPTAILGTGGGLEDLDGPLNTRLKRLSGGTHD